MILRRLSTAIREQDWFAVVIEFAIVVAGVLFAFQISEAASRQSERAYARDTMVRLERELSEIERVRGYTETFTEQRADGVAAARPAIMGVESASSLTPEQCFALSRSHIIDRPADGVPTLEEVTQSGILASIDNDELRLAIMRFASKRDAVREWVHQKSPELDDLAELYPDMVWYELVASPEDDDDWDRKAVCDLDTMRASRAFQAHMMGNYSILRDTKSFVFDFMDEAFVELHGAIDAELGITHDEEMRETP